MGSEERLRGTVRWVLGGGVWLSGILMALGLSASWLGSPSAATLLEAGTAILIATPAARVAILAGSYARARDWRFFAICACVLVLMVASLLIRPGH